MQFFQDTFTGADDTLLSAYNPGWVALSSTARLLAGRVRQAGTGTPAYVRTDMPAPSADYSVSFDVYTEATSGSPSVGALGRMSSNAITGYQVRYVRGSGLTLARFTNGTSSTLDSMAFTLNVGETVNLRLEMIGSAIKVYVNGSSTPSLSGTDTNITAPGYIGLRMASAQNIPTYLDNFVGDTVGGAAQSFTYAATGGFALAGAAAQSLARTLTPTGGLQFSGAAAVSSSLGAKVFQVVAAGGIAFSGIAQRIVSAARATAGGVIFGGAAVVANSDIVARGAALIRRRTRPRQPVSRR